MSIKSDLYQILDVYQHAEFENRLEELVFDKANREKFYMDLIATEWGKHLEQDAFKGYFEEYAAERKSNKQDFTPVAVSTILGVLTRGLPTNSKYTAMDMAAGTGSLIVGKWWDDCIQTPIFQYRPHNYFYYCEELSDTAIPYLLHNLLMRGMNAIVVHGNSLERTVKNIYFVQNSNDNTMGFSDLNVMPRNSLVEHEFKVHKWIGSPINHIESDVVTWIPGGAVYNEPISESHTKAEPYVPISTYTLRDIADVERAKQKKVYPRGTIVIQISATRGQIGWLKSSGPIPEKYACITVNPNRIDSYYLFGYLELMAPKHFHRVQEGLNLTLDNIETIPISDYVYNVVGGGKNWPKREYVAVT